MDGVGGHISPEPLGHNEMWPAEEAYSQLGELYYCCALSSVSENTTHTHTHPNTRDHDRSFLSGSLTPTHSIPQYILMLMDF